MHVCSIEGEEEMADSAGEVGEGLDGGLQTVKKTVKNSCHLKNKEEEALVLEWKEANLLLRNSKDKDFKTKTTKPLLGLWVEQAKGLNYDGKLQFTYLFVFVVVEIII